MKLMEQLNAFLNGIVWGPPMLVLMGFVGILMTVRTGFFQVTRIGHWVKRTIGGIFGNKLF